jgi:hypothetical protein
MPKPAPGEGASSPCRTAGRGSPGGGIPPVRRPGRGANRIRVPVLAVRLLAVLPVHQLAAPRPGGLPALPGAAVLVALPEIRGRPPLRVAGASANNLTLTLGDCCQKPVRAVQPPNHPETAAVRRPGLGQPSGWGIGAVAVPPP